MSSAQTFLTKLGLMEPGSTMHGLSGWQSIFQTTVDPTDVKLTLINDKCPGGKGHLIISKALVQAVLTGAGSSPQKTLAQSKVWELLVAMTGNPMAMTAQPSGSVGAPYITPVAAKFLKSVGFLMTDGLLNGMPNLSAHMKFDEDEQLRTIFFHEKGRDHAAALQMTEIVFKGAVSNLLNEHAKKHMNEQLVEAMLTAMADPGEHAIPLDEALKALFSIKPINDTQDVPEEPEAMPVTIIKKPKPNGALAALKASNPEIVNAVLSGEAGAAEKMAEAVEGLGLTEEAILKTQQLPKVKLASASKMYQPVTATTPSSKYFVVGLGKGIRVAARLLPTGALSVRVEGNSDVVKKAAINAGLTYDDSKNYASIHLQTQNVHGLVRKSLGAVLMGLGVHLDSVYPDTKYLMGE